MDHFDPYFLQPSYHPELVIVSQLLNGDNYTTQHRTITISLSAKNKLGFVDGTIKPLSKKNSKYPLCHRCNDMVTAWSDLQDRFSLGNLTHVFQIRRTIAEHKQGQQIVCQYYTKLKSP